MARDQINAFLGAGTSYQGTFSFQGTVRIDGDFHGEIESEGTLVVGKDAQLEGVFRVGQFVLNGTVRGEVVASKKTILHKESHFLGTLHTPVFVVEEGADIRGNVNMEPQPDEKLWAMKDVSEEENNTGPNAVEGLRENENVET